VLSSLRTRFWHLRAQRWLDELSVERISWFGAGLTVAAAGGVGYMLVVAPMIAAQATPPPPRPQPAPVRVQVVGEVVQPGSYDLPHTARVEDAVRVAGGLTEHADVAYVNLAARLVDGQRVVVSRLRAADGGRAYATPRPTSTRVPRPTATRTP
jgi:SLBB domain